MHTQEIGIVVESYGEKKNYGKNNEFNFIVITDDGNLESPFIVMTDDCNLIIIIIIIIIIARI